MRLQTDQHLFSECRQRDTHLFIKVDLLQVVVERIWEAGSYESVLRVICNALGVELALEEFESECVVQYSDVPSGWWVEVLGDGCTLFDGMSGDEAGSESDGWNEGVTHLELLN